MERQIHILAADALAEEGLEFIREQPDTVLAHKPGLSAAELSAIIGDYDGLIVRSGVQITRIRWLIGAPRRRPSTATATT